MSLKDREVEKGTAIAEVSAVLDWLSADRRHPDPWERVCLMRALSAVFSGCYSLAVVEARLAKMPRDRRSPDLEDRVANRDVHRCDLPFLSRALDAARAEPVRQLPLGPVAI